MDFVAYEESHWGCGGIFFRNNMGFNSINISKRAVYPVDAEQGFLAILKAELP